MFDINTLKFDENGLIPAVIVDALTKKVLTVAYMNRESLKLSMEKGLTCFWSRSRQELWTKGETSGNYQHIVSIAADCDRDALTVVVEKDGPACHTGTDSCFNEVIYQSEDRHEFSLEGLMSMLEGRKANPKEGSYTSYLFNLIRHFVTPSPCNLGKAFSFILLKQVYRLTEKLPCEVFIQCKLKMK